MHFYEKLYQFFEEQHQKIQIAPKNNNLNNKILL